MSGRITQIGAASRIFADIDPYSTGKCTKYLLLVKWVENYTCNAHLALLPHLHMLLRTMTILEIFVLRCFLRPLPRALSMQLR